MKTKMQEVIQDKINFKLKLDEQKDRLDLITTENANLKERLASVDEDAKQHRRTIKQLQTQAKNFHEMQQTFERA